MKRLALLLPLLALAAAPARAEDPATNGSKLDFRISTNGWLRCEEFNASTNDVSTPFCFLANDNNIDFVSLSNYERTDYGVGPEIDFVEFPKPGKLAPGEKRIESVPPLKWFRGLPGEYLDLKWVCGGGVSEHIVAVNAGPDGRTALPVVGRFDKGETVRLAFVANGKDGPQLSFLVLNGYAEPLSAETLAGRVNVLGAVLEDGTVLDGIPLSDVVRFADGVGAGKAAEAKLPLSEAFSRLSVPDSARKVTLVWTFGTFESALPLWTGSDTATNASSADGAKEPAP
jgi:hypothetical protein